MIDDATIAAAQRVQKLAAETLAELPTSHQIAILGRLLGAVACECGQGGRPPDMLSAHRYLGQAMGFAFGVVDEHFNDGDAE